MQGNRARSIRDFSPSLIALAVTHALLVSDVKAEEIILDENCTLVEAIKSANSDASDLCIVGSGADTISLIEDITLTEVYSAENGLPIVTSDITFNGGGFTIERDSAATDYFRLFQASGSAGKLTLNSLTLMGGRISDSRLGGAIYVSGSSSLYLNSVTVSNNTGGGVSFSYASSMTITNSEISNNIGTGVRAVFGAVNISDTVLSGNNGGGMYADATSSLSLANMTISNNEGGFGGGLTVFGSPLTISNSTVSGNRSTADFFGNGGGINVDRSSNFYCLNSRFFDNEANQYGGGLNISRASQAKIVNSSFYDNSAGFRGGGLQTNSDIQVVGTTFSKNTALDGGGIANQGGGSIEISNSTLSRNNATNNGGAIHSEEMSEITLVNSTLFGNSADVKGMAIYGFTLQTNVNIANTVIFGEATENCAGVGFNLVLDANNWFGDSSCNGRANGDPKLGELLDNGGPTATHEPLPNSGLAGRGNASFCQQVKTDQRGEPRATRCYVGAFEGPPPARSFYVIPTENGKSVVFEL